MTFPANLKFLLAIFFTAGVGAADSGDDFSNNVFSDLAPLLALFGERVVMQFMSQSMGWADNLILAMAPIGIITIIVSAIRVGGPSWLKAIIGRARENLAVAEMELMSSTSKEVCELWNRQEVVRCMGSAPVAEFICLLPEVKSGLTTGVGKTTDPKTTEVTTMDLAKADVKTMDLAEAEGKATDPTTAEVKTTDLATAKEGTYLTAIKLNIKEDFSRWRGARNLHSRRKDPEENTTDSSPSDIIIIRNNSEAAPNISLNCHNQIWRGELRVAAVFGSILQLGVLIYSGFATYYPTLKFSKGRSPVARYAFPCTAVGTCVLVAGMLVCGHVVESSTDEKRYEPSKGYRARLVWLQQKKTVSDQDFDSFAIFAKGDRNFITTSRRVDNQDGLEHSAGGKGESTASLDQHEEKEETALAPASKAFFSNPTVLAFKDNVLDKAVFGTLISLCGYIVQFSGLRGMHWSATIVQLGAVLVMTSLRAWVRRGLATPPMCQPLDSEFELDWFAMTFGDIDSAPWLQPREENEKKESKPWRSRWDWSMGTVGDPTTSYEPLQSMESKEAENPSKKPSKAHKVMMIRRDLGKLADWRGPASKEAIALARAIEITMDALVAGRDSGFTWILPACRGDTIHFRLRHQNGKWRAFSDEIEAALSLWLYSVNEEEMKAPKVSDGDDAWHRAKGTPSKLSLHLLGSKTPSLNRDLWWWMPRDAARIIEVEEKEEEEEEDDQCDKLEVENHRIVGCCSDPSGAPQHLDKRTRYKSCRLTSLSFDDKTKAANTILATESYSPLKLLYAQDMFSAFMWAVAQTPTKTFETRADIHPDDISGYDAWQSFTLRNDQLSRIAQDIQSTGLGSLEDIYLGIIPPLSAMDKLPQADGIIELARQQAKRHEQLENWKEASDVYLWLFQMGQTFPKESGIAAKATAVLMEYLRQVTAAIELREARHEKTDLLQLKELKSTMEEKLNNGVQEVLSNLIKLYRKQDRPWECTLMPEAGEEDTSDEEEDTSFAEMFNFTKAHQFTQSRRYFHSLIEELKAKENANARDIHDWTPLHYAAAKGSITAAKLLLRRQADANARDLQEWTPLHYACQNNETSIVQSLLRGGADVNVQGRNGVAPLHCAAKNGCQDVVSSLIEAGAAIDILDASGNTPLLWAAYMGHEDVVRYLEPDANTKLRDHNGRTALHLAAVAGKLDMSKLLANELGVKKEAKDQWGGTPLHCAAEGGHEAIVRLLVELGADKEAKDQEGGTPLHYAARGGHEAIMRLLVELGADKEAKDQWGGTPLHCAARGGHEAIVRLLVELGADKEAKDQGGRTPLYYAAGGGHEAIVRLLVELGADKEAKDQWGGTPLYCAARGGHEAIVRLLVELGADKEAKDQGGRTPLYYAAGGGHEAIVRLLVELGADKEAKDQGGGTPLYYAARGGHEAIVRLLVELGADKEAKDQWGRTPLHCAARGGHEAIVRLLVELGADKEAKDQWGRTPLHWVAGGGHEAIVRLLE
ncbi:Fc.00g027360.m01.CDS01 [Cosmosporella sp. VM-42]